jgi:hypothetical protein
MTFQPSSFYAVLGCFAPCFSEPSFQNFVAITVGWVFARDRHTISGALRAGMSQGTAKHFSVFYRFFSRANWVTDALGKILLHRLLPFIPGSTLVILGDDTLCRKTGPYVWGAGMHHDAVASSYGRKTGRPRHVAFAFGHNWVILAVWVPLPWNPARGVAIPILFRLYRSKKLCPVSDYRKRTTLAMELFKVLLEWNVELGRRLTLITDSEYACRTIVKHLPADVTFIGPVVMNAALFDFPSPQRKPGRGAPRKRGDRLPTPAQLITDTSHPWVETNVTMYGRSVVILVKTVTCLWYQVAGLRPVRLVITRDPKGHFEDRAFFCTDKDLSIVDVLRLFCCRWSLEVTFFNTKQFLGLEDPRNGWGLLKNRRRGEKRAGPQPRDNKGRKAVERTVPCLLYLHGLVYLWYFENGKPDQDVARARLQAPWYRHKREPSFADILDALRRDLTASPEFFMHPDESRVMQQFPPASEPLMAAACGG